MFLYIILLFSSHEIKILLSEHLLYTFFYVHVLYILGSMYKVRKFIAMKISKMRKNKKKKNNTFNATSRNWK